VSDYTPKEVSDLLASDPNVQLVDVRRWSEHNAGHIAGATLIELSELSDNLDQIDKDRPVVLYCRSGARSSMGAEALTQAGYDAHNMTGGLLEWDATGLPLEPADGRVAEL
jgi:rhodanese-related sulfurtransferase